MLTALLAAAEAEHSSNPMEFTPIAYITALVVFLIVIAVLGKFVWPKIAAALDARQMKILGEIDAAEKARADADAAKASFERELNSARDEMSKRISEVKADAQKLGDELRAKAEAEAQERLSRATAEIDGAKRAAIAEIHARGADLATAIASKILKRQINESDQHRLVEESIAELSGRRS